MEQMRNTTMTKQLVDALWVIHDVCLAEVVTV